MQPFAVFVYDVTLLEITGKRRSGGCSREFMRLLDGPFLKYNSSKLISYS